jgi:hypothetical protein
MRVSMMLSAVAVVAVMGFAGSAFARSASGEIPTASYGAYNACYQQSVDMHLSDQDLRKSADRCLSETSSQYAAQAGDEHSYNACRQDAIGFNLAGENLRQFLNTCVN